MEIGEKQTFWSGIWKAFKEGVTLAKPREWLEEWVDEKINHKSQKEEEERKRREAEEQRQRAIGDFKTRCKVFGWWMAALLTILFVGLTWLSLHLCDDYPFLQTIIIPILKWVFGIGFASYALYNMLIMWEKYFKRYVRKHPYLFEPPPKPIQSKHVRDFWFFMMRETMFWGWLSKIQTLIRKRKRTNKAMQSERA